MLMIKNMLIIGALLTVQFVSAQSTANLLVNGTWVLTELYYDSEPLSDQDGTCLIGLEITYQNNGMVSKYIPCTGVTEEIPYSLSGNTITGDEGEWLITNITTLTMTQTTQAVMEDHTTEEEIQVPVMAVYTKKQS